MSSLSSLSPSLPPFQQILEEVLDEAREDHAKIKTVIETTDLHPPGNRHMRLDYDSSYSDDRMGWHTGYYVPNNNALKETQRRISQFMQFKNATFDQTFEVLGFLKSRRVLNKIFTLDRILEEKTKIPPALTALIKSYMAPIALIVQEQELTLAHKQQFLEEKPNTFQVYAESRSCDPFKVISITPIPGTIIGQGDPITEAAHIHIQRALPNPTKETELLAMLKKENEA